MEGWGMEPGEWPDGRTDDSSNWPMDVIPKY